jgi:hypothetical protein
LLVARREVGERQLDRHAARPSCWRVWDRLNCVGQVWWFLRMAFAGVCVPMVYSGRACACMWVIYTRRC